MSYYPLEDNPDLAGLSGADEVDIIDLSDFVDASSSHGLHADNCGCDKGEACQYWRFHIASSEETIGWLVAQDLLSMEDVRNAIALQRGRGL